MTIYKSPVHRKCHPCTRTTRPPLKCSSIDLGQNLGILIINRSLISNAFRRRRLCPPGTMCRLLVQPPDNTHQSLSRWNCVQFPIITPRNAPPPTTGLGWGTICSANMYLVGNASVRKPFVQIRGTTNETRGAREIIPWMLMFCRRRVLQQWQTASHGETTRTETTTDSQTYWDGREEEVLAPPF